MVVYWLDLQYFLPQYPWLEIKEFKIVVGIVIPEFFPQHYSFITIFIWVFFYLFLYFLVFKFFFDSFFLISTPWTNIFVIRVLFEIFVNIFIKINFFTIYMMLNKQLITHESQKSQHIQSFPSKLLLLSL